MQQVEKEVEKEREKEAKKEAEKERAPQNALERRNTSDVKGATSTTLLPEHRMLVGVSGSSSSMNGPYMTQMVRVVS